MAMGLAGRLSAASAAVLISACVGGNQPQSNDFLAERDAARTYIVSDAADQASQQAIADIRAAGSDADRVLVDSYLADPAYARVLPAKYQDYLVEVFDSNQIDTMTAWDGDREAFAQQVDVHRFVLAQALVEWHIDDAGLDQTNVFDDDLVKALASVIRATPEPLIPPSRLSFAGGTG